MNLLNLLPQSLRVKLILRAISEVFDKLEAKHVGKELNAIMDAKIGQPLSNVSQKRLATWLRQVAEEVEA